MKNTPMSYQPLIHLLEAYHPTPEERMDYDVCIDFIQQHPRCFERDHYAGHVTASGWLLSPDEQQVLLMHHVKLNCWLQLGGHCDGEQDVLRSALREAEEESGMKGIQPLSKEIFDLDIHEIPPFKGEPAHRHFDIRFLMIAPNHQSPQKNNESHALTWFPPSYSAFPSSSPSILRMLKKWRIRLGFSD